MSVDGQIILVVAAIILLIGIGVGITVLRFGLKFARQQHEPKIKDEPNEYDE